MKPRRHSSRVANTIKTKGYISETEVCRTVRVIHADLYPPDSLTADQLISHCRKELTGYKVPKDVYFRIDLPKTNVGKILRRALRDELAPAFKI